MLLDIPFLERIKEGEIRLLIFRERVLNVTHKKPPETKHSVPLIQSRLGNYDLTLIWTAGFI